MNLIASPPGKWTTFILFGGGCRFTSRQLNPTRGRTFKFDVAKWSQNSGPPFGPGYTVFPRMFQDLTDEWDCLWGVSYDL